MKGVFRLIKRKKNVRRMIAAMFLFVFCFEMVSHVMIDSQDPDAVTAAISCSLDGDIPARADCPERRRQQQETKDLLDEMTTHAVLLNTVVIPYSGIMYRTGTNYSSDTRIVSRSLASPFRPPKQG